MQDEAGNSWKGVKRDIQSPSNSIKKETALCDSSVTALDSKRRKGPINSVKQKIKTADIGSKFGFSKSKSVLKQSKIPQAYTDSSDSGCIRMSHNGEGSSFLPTNPKPIYIGPKSVLSKPKPVLKHRKIPTVLRNCYIRGGSNMSQRVEEKSSLLSTDIAGPSTDRNYSNLSQDIETEDIIGVCGELEISSLTDNDMRLVNTKESEVSENLDTSPAVGSKVGMDDIYRYVGKGSEISMSDKLKILPSSLQ